MHDPGGCLLRYNIIKLLISKVVKPQIHTVFSHDYKFRQRFQTIIAAILH